MKVEYMEWLFLHHVYVFSINVLKDKTWVSSITWMYQIVHFMSHNLITAKIFERVTTSLNILLITIAILSVANPLKTNRGYNMRLKCETHVRFGVVHDTNSRFFVGI